MKIIAITGFALLALAGCTTADKASEKAAPVSQTQYDLTAVCLTDNGKPVSEGGTYKGKTCAKPNDLVVYPKPNLVWR
jgi:hypothetical protein